MDIGVVRAITQQEDRVALTPAGVRDLVSAGHQVSIETEAGFVAGFTDEDYRQAGALIVYAREEAFGRADLVLKVAPVLMDDLPLLRPGQIIASFGHLATLPPEVVRQLLECKVSALAYEDYQSPDGRLPILESMSEIGGVMAIMKAAQLSQSHNDGRGLLLSGLPGIPPPNVVILGAGTLGMAAARTALGMGAQVTLLDPDVARLRRAQEVFDRRVITYKPYRYNVEKVIRYADVLVGAVMVHGQRPPILIDGEMLRTMKKRAVFVDCSIDHGGIAETSRPTSFTDPAFMAEGVIHCCIPNMPSNVARTATFALNNAMLRLVMEIVTLGFETARRQFPGIDRAVYIHDGRFVHPEMAALYRTTATATGVGS